MPRSFVVLRVSAGSLLGNQLCGKTRLQYQLDKTQHSAVPKFIFPSYCEKKIPAAIFFPFSKNCLYIWVFPEIWNPEAWEIRVLNQLRGENFSQVTRWRPTRRSVESIKMRQLRTQRWQFGDAEVCRTMDSTEIEI